MLLVHGGVKNIFKYNGFNLNGIAIDNHALLGKVVVPIVLSTAVWGPQLAKHCILYKYDNLGVVSALHKGSIKDPIVMNLLRCRWFFVAHYDII